jgi:uncharacterized protein
MSQENVEIVRRIYGAAARRDTESVLELYDPDVEWEMPGPAGRMIGEGVYRGHEGLRRWFREWYEAWETVEEEIVELIDAGEQVISVVTARGRGRASGVEIDWQYASVWTIRDGKIARVVVLPSRDKALEAAGLPE